MFKRSSIKAWLPALIAGSFFMQAAHAEGGFFNRSSSKNKALDDRVSVLEQQVHATENLALIERIHTLEEELQLLYGMLEEQEHAIKLMERRQRELYADLDRRLGQATVQGPSVDAGSITPSVTVDSEGEGGMSAAEQAAITAALQAAERESYQTAYQFIRERQYQHAIDAFQTFLENYPEGDYAANAYYWLGELYLVEGDLDAAEQSFRTVLDEFPEHQKVPDAMLKLGQVLQSQDAMTEAQAAFDEVIARYPGTSTARLAETRLQALRQPQDQS